MYARAGTNWMVLRYIRVEARSAVNDEVERLKPGVGRSIFHMRFAEVSSKGRRRLLLGSNGVENEMFRI